LSRMDRFEKGKFDDFQRARFDFGGTFWGAADPRNWVPGFGRAFILEHSNACICPPEDVCHTLGEEGIFQWRESYTKSGASGVGGEENDCKDWTS
jgi:hypothetical protein